MTTDSTPPFAQLSDFEPWVGEVFRLTGAGDVGVEATLVEAKFAKSDTPKTTPRAPFSLLFKLDASVEAGQGAYQVDHPDAGNHVLFLTPVWVEDEGRFLEAVFN